MSELATITITIEDNDVKVSTTLPMPETYLAVGQVALMIASGQLLPDAE